MMMPSHMLQKLRQEIEQRPLQDEEFRRIEGMGSHFISRQSLWGELKHFFKFSLEDGTTIYVFKKQN